MNSTPCSVSRDEVRHDLNTVEYTDDEIREAERRAHKSLLDIRPVKGWVGHRDGRKLVEEALEEYDDLEFKELTNLIYQSLAYPHNEETRDNLDRMIGKSVREEVRRFVEGMEAFRLAVDMELNSMRAAEAERAELDRGEL